MSTSSTPCILVLLSALSVAGFGPVQSGQGNGDSERFTATAVSPGGPRSGGGVTPVDIVIDRWSTPADEQRLVSALKQDGADEMLDVLRELEPVGSIQVPGGLAYELHYARQMRESNGNRRIVLATDRPMTHWEIATGARIRDYPFTFVELNLDDEGKGEGELTFATKVEAAKDGNFVGLTNYAVQPIQLNNVKESSR